MVGILFNGTNPPIFSACEVNPSPDNLNIQIGEQNITVKKIKVDDYYGCEILKIKTKSGKQFNMELKFFGTKEEKQALELLKSSIGLTVVSPS